MKKDSIIFVSLLMMVAVLCLPTIIKATDDNSTSTTGQNTTLQQQIEILKAQIAALNTQLESLRQLQAQIASTTQGIKGTLSLIRQLRTGMNGEDVKTLQEILATDPEIYPEGLITGYYGKLTEKAVKKFQLKAGLEQVGSVGPKTLSKINEILQEGAGKSGKVPPGLLIAPGIRKKLGFSPTPLPGQELPPGIAKKIGTSTPATSTPDATAPVISQLTVSSITATSASITWMTSELANSKIWYSTSTPLVIAGATPQVSSADLVLNRTLGISNLSASTTYYYVVASADASGNTATSTENLFVTSGQ